MNRRNFLGALIGGVATAAAARTFPFRVFSFPSKIEVAPILQATSVRFVRAFDPVQGKMINRFDALYGFGVLDSLRSVESCHVASALIDGQPLTQQEIDYFKENLAGTYGREVLAVPARAETKNHYDRSKQIIVGWDIES